MRDRGKKAEWQQQIAKERIEILFGLADKEFKKHPERARRYVELARKIGLRYNVRLGKELKRKFCEGCNSIMLPGKTSAVRLDSSSKTIIIKCLVCEKIYRQPYKK
jgi:ribonuclease P protein subunit RPR2